MPKGSPFTEREALKSGLMFEEGHELMKAFVSNP